MAKYLCFSLLKTVKTSTDNTLEDQGIHSKATTVKTGTDPINFHCKAYITLRPLTCHSELIHLAKAHFSTKHSLSHSTVACLASQLAVAMAPHGAPGAPKVSTSLQSEAESEKPASVMGRLKGPIGEGSDKVRRVYKATGAFRAQCSDKTPKKFQVGRRDKKVSASHPVFQRRQIFFIVLYLLFNHSHAGRILMYLPVATR